MELDRDRVKNFLYREARLADEHKYEAWEELWTDDGHYWVPATHEDVGPEEHVSLINDIRPRITTRVEQLKTGDRHSQDPPTPIRRLITNVEVGEYLEDEYTTPGPPEDEDVTVASNFLLVHSRRETTLWAGRYLHRLREVDGDLMMALKKVMLANNLDETPTLTFLI
jgi:benzoate/toluate 1,2-dioxygenase beta subunit